MFRSILLIVLCVITATPVMALEDFMREQPTAMEFLLLPKYCAARMSDNQQLWQPYTEAYGERNFVYINHYCTALNAVNRYFRTVDPHGRAFLLRSALAGFDYTLRNVSPDFPLRPEILVQSGMALMLAKRPGDAGTQFLKAIQLKPDYVPAYLQLSNFYKELGDRAHAIGVLQDGLKQVPDSALLKRNLADLSNSRKSDKGR